MTTRIWLLTVTFQPERAAEDEIRSTSVSQTRSKTQTGQYQWRIRFARTFSTCNYSAGDTFHQHARTDRNTRTEHKQYRIRFDFSSTSVR